MTPSAREELIAKYAEELRMFLAALVFDAKAAHLAPYLFGWIPTWLLAYALSRGCTAVELQADGGVILTFPSVDVVTLTLRKHGA